MGEYALYEGQRIKIGTCEDMYYLRWDQAHLVKPLRGNADPFEDCEELRFRFPFPDEDDRAPGAFDDFDRGLFIPGIAVPSEVSHYGGECAANGVELVQQRWWEGKLVIVCRCVTCNAKYRYQELGDALPVLAALGRMEEEAGAGSPEARRLRLTAGRVRAGYAIQDREMESVELDGAVVVLPDGTELAMLQTAAYGSYRIQSAENGVTKGRLNDLYAMGLAGPGDKRYRVYYPAGECTDLATPEEIAVRIGGQEAGFRIEPAQPAE